MKTLEINNNINSYKCNAYGIYIYIHTCYDLATGFLLKIIALVPEFTKVHTTLIQ